MNNLQRSVLSWNQEDTGEMENVSLETAKLEEIRLTSNVVQALENAAVQSEGLEDFTGMHLSLQSFLEFSRRRLNELIHQP